MTDFTLNMPSVNRICGDSREVVVYGYRGCKYDDIEDLLSKQIQMDQQAIKEKKSPEINIKRVFSYGLGNTYEGEDPATFKPIDGHLLIMPKTVSKIKHLFKGSLVDVVFENYKRLKEGKGRAIIPVLFCIDYDKNPHTPTAESITKDSDGITNQELRRCYKLIYDLESYDFEDDKLSKEELAELKKELADVAKQTFKFVKLTTTKKDAGVDEVELKPVEPFKAKEWKEAMKKRREKKGNEGPQSNRWVKELIGHVKDQFSTKEKAT